MKYFCYDQNNSGGAFVFDREKGITHHVVIEAEDDNDADERAERIGLYFDGIEAGLDCACCGDRWYRAYGGGDDTPKVYQDELGVKKPPARFSLMEKGWMAPNPEAVLHKANGEVIWFNNDLTFEVLP